MSMTIREAKKQRTFICEYNVKRHTINGKFIKTIFAEKKYWRDGSFQLKKTINSCESQLVIVSDDYFSQEATGFGYDWYIPGFETIGSYEIHASFKGTLFPDSILIKVISKGKNANIPTKFYLTKIKDDNI